jgi:hypothetical protein
VNGHAQPIGTSAARTAARAPRCERRERIFRHVNERIRELARTFDFGEPLQMFCECARSTCDARLTIDHGHYDEVRALGSRFFVHPGHERPESETVVERREGYTVVEER